MKIFCIGRNYADHIQELQNEKPEEPLIFMKPATALNKSGQFFYPDFSTNIHFEGELVLRIGKNGKRIEPEFALSYIDAISLGFDFTARDLQEKLKSKGNPWEKCKGFDQSAALGQWLEPVDDYDELHFEIFKNNQPVQKGDTSLMLFSPVEMIVEISKYFTLQKGDLIYTGTPAGVGPVEIGDHLKGTLNGQEVLKCEIK